MSKPKGFMSTSDILDVGVNSTEVDDRLAQLKKNFVPTSKLDVAALLDDFGIKFEYVDGNIVVSNLK